MSASRSPVTLFLGAREMVRLVQRKGLAACIAGIASRIETEFGRWEAFDLRPRVACHSPGGVIELMPVADRASFAFKYVNGHPGNTAFGLPTVMAFGVLADVATGAPRLLAEMTLATAIRTAAMSAVAARALARPESRSMALIGNGAQAEFQALAMRDLVGVRELRLYDVDPRATAKLVANLVGHGFALRVCSSVAEAAAGADIVTTATADKTRAAIVVASMVEPGMHFNAVGGDCPGKTELHPGVLEAAAVFVEYEPQTRIEGDLQQMPADFPATEIWQVLAGRHPGRADAGQVTVFDSVGFALEDHAALGFIGDAAVELGIGETIELVPGIADPKDLYGLLRGGDPPPQPFQRAASAPASASARACAAPKSRSPL